MWVKDATTGVLRLATRAEEQENLGFFPERFRAEGTWIFDEATKAYRQATRDEALEISHDEPSNWRYEREEHERERRRRRRRRHRRRDMCNALGVNRL